MRPRLRAISLYQWLSMAILLLALVTRLWQLGSPPTYMFDEVYHAVTAKLIAKNDPRAYEWWNPPPEPNTAVDWLHPPLVKLVQASTITAFGDTSFAWRLSSAVFGVLTIALVMVLAREWGFSRRSALLAGTLLLLDGLALTMARITMNDTHITFFMVFTVWAWWRWYRAPTARHALAVGLGTGLAIASKWSGVFLLPIILCFHLTTSLRDRTLRVRQLARLSGILLLSVPLLYMASYAQMFLQGKNWSHWQELHNQIWWYQTHLDATHPYQSVPWQWVLNVRPVYTYLGSARPGHDAQIYLLQNPVIAWAGAAAVLALIGWIGHQVRFRHRVPAEHAALVCAYALPWLPWVFSPRIMFYYHYLPAVPFLCLALAEVLDRTARASRAGTWLLWGVTLLAGVSFVLFYPHWTGMEVPRGWLTSLYFALPSWR